MTVQYMISFHNSTLLESFTMAFGQQFNLQSK